MFQIIKPLVHTDISLGNVSHDYYIEFLHLVLSDHMSDIVYRIRRTVYETRLIPRKIGKYPFSELQDDYTAKIKFTI